MPARGGADYPISKPRWRNALWTRFPPVVGADHVRSSVTIEYNPNSGESTEELYDPDATALLTSQTTQDQTSGTPAMGIPGTPSNVPSPPHPAAPAASTPPSPAQPNTAPANSAQSVTA